MLSFLRLSMLFDIARQWDQARAQATFPIDATPAMTVVLEDSRVAADLRRFGDPFDVQDRSFYGYGQNFPCSCDMAHVQAAET